MGIMQFNKQNHERAKDELKHILQLLNNYLRTKTYLVGERITLADIAVASDLLLLFQWVKKSSLTCFSMNSNFDFFRSSNQVYENHIQM
jgi:elongation factor 1-gamma